MSIVAYSRVLVMILVVVLLVQHISCGFAAQVENIAGASVWTQVVLDEGRVTYHLGAAPDVPYNQYARTGAPFMAA
jgi:hypothetical protein